MLGSPWLRETRVWKPAWPLLKDKGRRQRESAQEASTSYCFIVCVEKALERMMSLAPSLHRVEYSLVVGCWSRAAAGQLTARCGRAGLLGV